MFGMVGAVARSFRTASSAGVRRRLALGGALGFTCLVAPAACSQPLQRPSLVPSLVPSAAEPALAGSSLSLGTLVARWSAPEYLARLGAEALGTGLLVQLGCAVACADRYISPIGTFGA